MNKTNFENIKFIVVIAGRKQKEHLLADMSAIECKIINVVYGKSSVTGGYLLETLGFIPEENKVLITCLLPSDKVGSLHSLLTDKYNFGDHNTGIAFAMPVNGLVF